MDVSILKINERSYNIKDVTARSAAEGANSAAREAATTATNAVQTANTANTTAQKALEKAVGIEYAAETITFTLGG